MYGQLLASEHDPEPAQFDWNNGQFWFALVLRRKIVFSLAFFMKTSISISDNIYRTDLVATAPSEVYSANGPVAGVKSSARGICNAAVDSRKFQLKCVRRKLSNQQPFHA